MPRKLRRKPANARSRRGFAIGTLRAYVKGSEGSVAVAVDAAVVEVETSIDVHLDTRDPHPHEDVARLVTTSIEGHPRGGKWIRTSLANVGAAAGMREDVGRDQPQAQFPAPDLGPSPLHAAGRATMRTRDKYDGAMIRAGLDRHLLEGEVPGKEAGEGAEIVVITEQELYWKLLAHVRLEDHEGDLHLFLHVVAHPLHGLGNTEAGVAHRQGRGHVRCR